MTDEQDKPEYVGGMELVGMTMADFQAFCFNACPSNMPLKTFIMRLCHEANRVHENDVKCRRALNPGYSPDPTERPTMDIVALLSYCYRPGWQKVHEMGTLERLRKLEKVHGGRFAVCARKDLDKMHRDGNQNRHESSRDSSQVTHRDARHNAVTMTDVTGVTQEVKTP